MDRRGGATHRIDEHPPSAPAGQKAEAMSKNGFVSPVKDFYLTNPIARASAVMAECSALARNNFQAAAE